MHQNNMEVMVMDDEIDVRHTLKESLEPYDFKVRLAPTAKRAESLLRSHKFLAVSIDIRMQHGTTSGLEIIQLCRRLYPSIYIQVLTGYKNYKDISLESGADEVLIKGTQQARKANKLIIRGVVNKLLLQLESITNFKFLSLISELQNHSKIDLILMIKILVYTLSVIEQDLLINYHPNFPHLATGMVYSSLCSYIITNDINPNKFEIIQEMKENIIRSYANESEAMANDRNINFVQENLEELGAKYPNMYIVVIDGELKQVGSKLDEIINNTDQVHSATTNRRLIYKVDPLPKVVYKKRGPRISLYDLKK